MRARLVSVLFVSMLVLAAGSWAQEDSGTAGDLLLASIEADGAAVSLNRELPIEPWIHPKMSPQVTQKLRAAVRIAVERIEEVEECGELFFRLGADGEEMLRTTLYFPVSSHNRKNGTCRKAIAYTDVGSRSTFVCPEFSRLSDERAALIIVHEALHYAGLPEKPQDRRAKTSLAINSMVGRSCRF